MIFTESTFTAVQRVNQADYVFFRLHATCLTCLGPLVSSSLNNDATDLFLKDHPWGGDSLRNVTFRLKYTSFIYLLFILYSYAIYHEHVSSTYFPTIVTQTVS